MKLKADISYAVCLQLQSSVEELKIRLYFKLYAQNSFTANTRFTLNEES